MSPECRSKVAPPSLPHSAIMVMGPTSAPPPATSAAYARAATPVLLALTCVLAFTVRLHPVVRWGSVIHEYDPHFNYRVTRVLRAHGSMALRDWFDDRAWYPLGRSVGETVYPGLMVAAVALQWVSETLLRIPLDTRHACVFVAPVFSALACLAMFALTLQVTKRRATALMAAAIFSICPAYISRSTAGSFDNEGVAIFLLINTFWLWVRAVQSGGMFDACFAALSYFAMVVSWGGYVFIINLIPLHVLALVACGRYSSRLYVAYSTFYPLASLMSMQVPFVGFNTITKAESAGSHAVFMGLQAFAFAKWLQGRLSTDQFKRVLHIALGAGISLLCIGVTSALALGKLQWSGRSLTLLHPTYASKYIPIIASVGEHQPPAWGNFYLSLGPIMLLAPLGLFYCFDQLDEGHLFMIIYAVFSFYFSGIMVRLLLTLAPAACFLSALGTSTFITTISGITKRQNAMPVDNEAGSQAKLSAGAPDSGGSLKMKRVKASSEIEKSSAALAFEKERALHDQRASAASLWSDVFGALFKRFRFDTRAEEVVPAQALSDFLWLLIIAITLLLVVYVRHCAKVSHIAFSSTSMTYQSRDAVTHETRVHDDYREAYSWLRMNAEPDARILSWWDYGYQLSALANRTVIVDNNTWNNTHIATVGRVLASTEEDAWPILQSLDVDYIFILFGGRIGMHGDDLDKLPWILRISQGVFSDDIIESEFMINGLYMHDTGNATSAMKESMLYKMSYYRFFDQDGMSRPVIDKSRGKNTLIDASRIQLSHLEEAYTSDAWIARIYRVRKGKSIRRN